MTELELAQHGTAELNAALAKAQGEFPAITRDKTVTVQTKTGGKYTFSYAPLDTILAACRPVLAKHGLALTQLLEHNGNGPSIRTELRHANGGVLGASFPLPGHPDSPQQLGSLLTYLRRYAIVALLGIASEEDDDGQQAASTPMKRRNPDHGPRQRIVIGPDVDPLEAPDEPGPDFGPIEDPGLEQAEEQTTFQAPDLGALPLEDKDRRKIYAIAGKIAKIEPEFETNYNAFKAREYGTEAVSELNRRQARQLILMLEAKELRLRNEGLLP